MANVLSQETDGQISLVMPERENLEKQITGQMNIEDILAEWERMKKENEEKRKEEVRLHVLQQTGTMFTEFEASVRDGLLEQLEREKGKAVDSAAQANESVEEEAAQADVVSAELAEAEKTLKEPEWSGEAQEGSHPEEVNELQTDEVEELEEIEEPVESEQPESWEEPEESEQSEEWEEPVESEQSESWEEPEESEQSDSWEEPVESEQPEEEELPEELEEAAEDQSGKEKPGNTGMAVVREKAKVRGLSREEKELYAPFIQSKSAREQLVKAIDGISMAAYTGNVIITGEEGMDTLTLAKNMIREVQMTDRNFSGKVAKISGQSLNAKDAAEIIARLKNGALIIQKASGMDENTAKTLYKTLQQESMGIIVVMEDTKKAMNKFLAVQKQLAGCFTSRMDVEALSNDMLVAFGRQYAREMEYSIDELGVLALHTRIEDMQTIDHAVTVVEVKEIVDEAIRHANRKTIGHFFDILFAKRYDEEDMIILNEKDFA